MNRAQIYEKFRQLESQWSSLTEDSPDHILILDKEMKIQFVNFASPGLKIEDLIGKPLYTYVEKKRQKEIKSILEKVLKTGMPSSYETSYHTPEDDIIYYESRVVARRLKDSGEIIGLTLIARDITERKLAEIERDKLIEELKEALNNVKILSGLLPICMSCKKIRDDKGYWHQVEIYIKKHSEINFSHGLCPNCAQKLYPELINDKSDEKIQS